MAPHRDTLSSYLEELKGELSGTDTGPADAQRGEAHATVDVAHAMITEIAGIELVADVDAFMRNTDMSLLDDDQVQRVEDAADQRLAVLRGKK